MTTTATTLRAVTLQTVANYRHAAERLGLCEALAREGGLPGGLGAVDLDDAAAGDAATAEGVVERDAGAGAAVGVVLTLIIIAVYVITNLILKDSDLEY